MSDLQFYNHGFAIACMPQTQEGVDWLLDNITGETTHYGALLIEPRYLEDIVLAARADGLECEG